MNEEEPLTVDDDDGVSRTAPDDGIVRLDASSVQIQQSSDAMND